MPGLFPRLSGKIMHRPLSSGIRAQASQHSPIMAPGEARAVPANVLRHDTWLPDILSRKASFRHGLKQKLMGSPNINILATIYFVFRH